MVKKKEYIYNYYLSSRRFVLMNVFVRKFKVLQQCRKSIFKLPHVSFT